MPPAFPDPVLALSLASIHKLNDVDVDQLAHLWTVFTKCAESLESGRRLENLSWRLWFREAHLLPPDSSLSDLADATPLGTPISLSRTGSLVGSYAAGRLGPQQLQQRLQQQQQQQQQQPQGQPTRPSLASIAAADQLSDPEGGDGWSDEDEESDKEEEVRQGRAEQPRQAAPPTHLSAQSPAPPASTSLTPLRAQAADRKRASSSSSAFGSRARVKHHNTGVLASAVAAAAAGGPSTVASASGSALARAQAQAALARRRPLSFPAAIESLVLDAREHADVLSCHQRQRPASADPAKTERRYEEPVDSVIKGDAPSSLPSSTRDAVRMPPPSQPIELKPAAAAIKAKDAAATEELKGEASVPIPAQIPAPPAKPAPQPKSKFFVAVGSQGRSFEDEDEDETPNPPAHHKARSEAGSTTSSNAASRKGHNGHAQHQQHHHHHHAAHHAAHHGGLHGGNRSRSGAALHRAGKKLGHAHGHGHHGGHGRTGSGLTALTPATKKIELPKDEWEEEKRTPVSPKKPAQKLANGASEAEEASKAIAAPAVAPAPAAASATKAAAPTGGASLKAASPKRKKRPVKFTMGADEDEDDEFTDDEAAPAVPPAPVAAPAPALAAKAKLAPQEEDDDDDAWSSDSSEDAEEERRSRAIQRVREEAERQESMFKKVKIRSASAADLRHAASKPASRAPSPARASPPPVRGLLSSLFHPEQEPHPPPGQLAGRSHASAADLRHKPSQLHISPMTSMAPHKPQQQKRQHSHESAGSNGSAQAPHLNGLGKLPRVPSAHPVGEGGLRTSKSAVALPVLSTAASRSSTNVRSALTASTAITSATAAAHSTSSDQHKAPQPGSGGQHDSSPEGAKPSSAALARLNRLAAARGGRHSSTPVAAPSMAYSGHLEAHVDGAADFEAPQNLRRSASSGAVHREQDQPRYDTSHQRPAPSESVAAPGMAQYRATAVPAPSLPQTPRTTRRNMLRDELSESLRQNLLWERQSRNRMLGIGAPVTPLPPQQTQRRETVLGGGALRPLTQAGDRRSTGGAGRPAYNEEGGFHRQGW